MNHETKVPDVGTDDIAGLGKALQVVRCDQDRQFLAFLLTVAKRQPKPFGVLAYDGHQPDGGWENYLSTHATLEEAEAAATLLLKDNACVDVCDTRTHQPIHEWQQ